MQLNTTWQRLCECLGLSEYEAKVYVSLIEVGTAKARTLSVMSGVPRTKVYGVLRKLIDLSLVAEVPGEPVRFAPTPPRIAFKSYLDSYQSMVDNLLSVVSSLEEVIKKAKSEGRPQRGTIWIIHGREEILGKMREMLSRAKRFVHLAANENGMVLLYRIFNRLFDELAERAVKVKIIIPSDSDSQHMLSELRYTCKVEKSSFPLPLIFLCTDGKQLLLADLQTDGSSSSSELDRGIFSDEAVIRDMISLLITQRVGSPAFRPVAEETEETSR